MIFSKQKLADMFLDDLKNYYYDHREEQETDFDTWLFQIDRSFIEEIIGW